MRYRRFGRTDWQVSEVGFGMWSMGGQWGGTGDEEAGRSLDLAVDLGCNFFDTAWAYGDGHSEQLLGKLVRAQSNRRLYTASKIPPKHRRWPSRRGDRLDDVFPPDYIREYTERSLGNLGLERVDLMQFHVWEDAWAGDPRWQGEVERLRDEGLVSSWGVSVNRWEPWNVLETLKAGLIDSVQVVYNIFDQSPEDELFPACEELDVAVIARVPFDEGSLTGTLSIDTTWPQEDWRNLYFTPKHLRACVEHADALKSVVPQGMTMADMALRFILANSTVSTVIPGMRRPEHVRSNLAAADGARLPAELLADLRRYRWDRRPDEWPLG